ncbi:replication licensing factor Cdt1 [Crenichthys baileyi]|uniref:Replication licensing factor Cdt1 n=1 Tax=Crenichthys baileyi TaxID=28760 RepID=A0AAV9R4V5_9TELE
MSQARVTDFFCQRKKVVRGAAKQAGKQRSGGVRGSSAISFKHGNKDSALCSSTVHEEFVRVIDEAAGLINDGESVSTEPKDLSSPRTPKRSSADAEFDLGAAVFSATAEHSSVKKRRQAGGVRETEANTSEKTSRRTARKKLVLHDETPQALCKEDITALKSRLQRIKKQAEDIASPTSSAPLSTPPASSSPAASNSAALPVPTASGTSTTEARPPRFSVARAKELAAKAQRMKEEREAGEIKPAENPDSTEQPAYQRYHTLAQAVPPGLSLPYHYKILAEMFRSMDTVVAMLYNRSETTTFAKVKQGVQDMMHKRFEESHIGQIKTVFPEAYTFKQEKNIPTFNRNISKGSYQLTVEPVLSSDQNEVRPVLSASRLLERRHIFHQNLISVVKQHHKTFLSLLVPPVSVPEDKLTRWHPRFNVDTVPAIQVSSLPQVLHTDKLSTAQEVLEKARSLITPKMEKALASLARNTEDKDGEGTKPICSQNPTVPQASISAAAQVPSSLKGVSQSLLDRIRAKEAQKLQAAMTRNPAQEERLLMMSRLGELARILRNVFVAEKKAALIMEVACNRMVASYRSALSPGEMEKHVRLLAEVAPDWLSIHPVRKDFYLKLNKMVEVSIVLDKLNRRLKEEEGL